MNISELNTICKLKSRSVFEDAKHSLVNQPFANPGKGIVEDIIEFSIRQQLGSKILKTFVERNALQTQQQINVATDMIKKYEALVIHVFRNFAVNIYNRNV